MFIKIYVEIIESVGSGNYNINILDDYSKYNLKNDKFYYVPF